MIKKVLEGILFLFAVNLCLANDLDQAWIDPLPPLAPVIVPGESNQIDLPRLPAPPPLPANPLRPPEPPALPWQNNSNPGNVPGSSAQNQGPVREIERYDLIVSGAFPNGNLRTNVANTISGARYRLYSDSTIALEIFFTNGIQYVYHLSDPGPRIEMGPGLFRVTYVTTVQAGAQFLLEQSTSELFSNAEQITSINIIGNNAIYVIMNFAARP